MPLFFISLLPQFFSSNHLTFGQGLWILLPDLIVTRDKDMWIADSLGFDEDNWFATILDNWVRGSTSFSNSDLYWNEQQD